ncbi:MAG TPA: amidohydrolase family protein [Longimicrobium sp.]|jgi:imidazolonepropionase-like amidohydrolase|uniref:amidohydrolase family protein n=2 Tax=Longimicrobium sp. TaxID=2029185 RepID=UPI002ED8EE9C
MMCTLMILAAAFASIALPLHAQVAVRGETVYTMAGAAIRDGVVLIGANGKIERVGPASEVHVPAGYRVVTGRVVTPGLVDAHSVVGLAGALGQAHDQDQLDRTEALQPELRAIDAYNARDELVSWLRGFGVTTVHTGHGPGALISGQTMIVKTRGDDVGDALVDTATMVAFTLGPSVGQNFRNAGTRARGMALVRTELIRAQEYARKQRAGDAQPRDLGHEVLGRVLNREMPALITANRVSEILAALRLKEEFGFDLVLDGAAESYMVIDEIRRAGVPVIIHPSMVRLTGETQSATLETARRLREAGITVALQSGYEGYVPKTRVVLFEAAIAAANGMAFEDALRTITIDAARVIGLGDRVGSLERGKDGDVAVFDGDPFEYTSHVCAVVIEGQVVSETCR